MLPHRLDLFLSLHRVILSIAYRSEYIWTRRRWTECKETMQLTMYNLTHTKTEGKPKNAQPYREIAIPLIEHYPNLWPHAVPEWDTFSMSIKTV